MIHHSLIKLQPITAVYLLILLYVEGIWVSRSHQSANYILNHNFERTTCFSNI